MSKRAVTALVLGTVLSMGCYEGAAPDGVGSGAQALTPRGATRRSEVDACARAIAPPLRELSAAVSAHERGPSTETLAAIASLLTPWPSGSKGEAGAVEPSAAARAMSDDELTSALGDATVLATCKMLRATQDLASGTLETRVRTAQELGLEDARRRAARADDRGQPSEPREDAGTTADAGATADAGTTADAGATADAGTTADAGAGQPGLLTCRPLRLTDEELRRFMEARTEPRWWGDGGSGVGLYWGVLGRQQPNGTLFGVFGAYREVDGGCFIGIGGSFTF